jgi:hypothetical protein
MNYMLKIKADDSHMNVKYYEAQVWGTSFVCGGAFDKKQYETIMIFFCAGKLPAHGGGYEVTKLEEISPEAAGAINKVG